MTLAAGTRIGAYEIIALVGAGGMGEVYRALDTRLRRDVALKVLPEPFAADPERLARFGREAEVLAALNHPHIAAIYGVEEQIVDDSAGAERQTAVRALVIELVEGETLAERIARGPVPVDEALPLARQIADALDTAHEQGIIHRDLKPANIKLRDDGTVKVLDFGLAKLADPVVVGAPGSSGLSISPTITSPALLTGVGTLLGTAAYMSPEQAKGRPADRRSDVWAFGCVLFEMLSGKRAFEGDDVTETIAAIVRGEPDWAALPPDTPPSVSTLLKRCLEKDRRARVSGMAAALFAFDEQRSLIAPAPSLDRSAINDEIRGVVEKLRRQGRRRLVAAAIAGVLVSAAAALAAWVVRTPRPPAVSKLALAPVGPAAPGIAANSPDLAITPDGSRVVYFTNTRGIPESASLAVRRLDQLEAVPLRLTQAFAPFVSPDGAWVGFNAQGERAIKKVSILGGAAVTIVSEVAPLRGASWAPDDTIIFGTVGTAVGLWRVPAAGGKPTPLTTIEKGKTDSHAHPQVLPGGKAVLFTVMPFNRAEGAQIAVLDLQTLESRTIIPRGSYPRYSPSGHIVYASGSTLFAVGFDLQRLRVTTDPVPVLEGVVTKGSGVADFDIAANGTLVFVPGSGLETVQRMVFVSPTGQQTPVPDMEPGDYRSVRVSPAGTQIAFETRIGSDGNLWTYDIERAVRNPLTTGDADDRSPLWHPTENRIVFGSNRDGRWGLFAVNADGTGMPERLMTDEKAVEVWPYSFSRDGKAITFGTNTAANGDIGIFPVAGGAVDYRLRTEFVESHAVVSPDGAWIAYASQRAGQARVYLERYPQLGDRRTISTGSGGHPAWRRDGRELYYIDSQNQQMMAVPITPGRELVVGSPKPLFKAPFFLLRGWRTFDVMPDGRFVVILRNESETEEPVNPIVVQNWTQELTQKVK